LLDEFGFQKCIILPPGQPNQSRQSLTGLLPSLLQAEHRTNRSTTIATAYVLCFVMEANEAQTKASNKNEVETKMYLQCTEYGRIVGDKTYSSVCCAIACDNTPC
jgi:hypothetical protein